MCHLTLTNSADLTMLVVATFLSNDGLPLPGQTMKSLDLSKAFLYAAIVITDFANSVMVIADFSICCPSQRCNSTLDTDQ